MIDLNAEMLSLGRQKIKNKNINFYLANAEELNFKNNIYDKDSDIVNDLKEQLLKHFKENNINTKISQV